MFPESAPKVVCSLSRPLLPDGSTGKIIDAYLEIDRILVWTFSGETIYNSATQLPVSEDFSLEFTVLPVDAEGVLDSAGNVVNNWVYTLTVEVEVEDGRKTFVPYKFQPTLGSNLDLDLIPHADARSLDPVTTYASKIDIVLGIEDFETLSGGTP